MKYAKILALATVAAAALTAFVGAGSASATVLCTTPGTGTPTGTTCPEGWAYTPATHEIHAVLKAGTKSKLVTSFKTIECGKSTWKGKQTNGGSATETVSVPLEAMNFEECNCEVWEVKRKGELEVHWIEGTHNGTVTSTGTELTTLCNVFLIGKVHCTYITNKTDLGTVDGGNPATLTVKEAKIPVDEANSDGVCPEKSEWNAEYITTTPLYVTGHT